MFSNNIKETNDNIWTPSSIPPEGYKLVVHRYYTEIVPKKVNIPKTPMKKMNYFNLIYLIKRKRRKLKNKRN